MEYLPEDLKKEVLKYNPYYPRISKSLFNRQMFNEQFCNIPITPSEVLSSMNPGDYFFMYVDTASSFDVYYCHKTARKFKIQYIQLSFIHYKSNGMEMIGIDTKDDRDEYTEGQM